MSNLDNSLLETITRARAIRKTCAYLLTHNFSSPAPEDLAKTIGKICKYLEDALIAIYSSNDHDAVSKSKIFRDTDQLIRELGAHVRYIDAARVERLPWSIIPAFQKLAKRLLPNAQIMIRPQWNYNYSVNLSDFRGVYNNALTEYEDYVPGTKVSEDVLSSLKGPFYLISFPSLERKNILLHSLIGHELGHLFAADYINKERKDAFSAAVMPEIERIVEKEISESSSTSKKDDDLFLRAKKENLKLYYLNQALTSWERGLEELLSDIVGAILFGPAALFASYEVARQFGFDFMPSSDTMYYPPWRMRLREILRFFNNRDAKVLPVNDSIFYGDKIKTAKVNQHYEQIRLLCSTTEDQDTIQADPIVKLAYGYLIDDLQKGADYVLDKFMLKDELVKLSKLYKNMCPLIERLENGIPPNGIDNNVNERINAAAFEIINAAWLHRLSWETKIIEADKSFNEESFKLRDRLNNLTLKAVEYSDIESEYLAENGIPEKFNLGE
jgi:hypothetical protein